jgi:hypothetical protein
MSPHICLYVVFLLGGKKRELSELLFRNIGNLLLLLFPAIVFAGLYTPPASDALVHSRSTSLRRTETALWG